MVEDEGRTRNRKERKRPHKEISAIPEDGTSQVTLSCIRDNWVRRLSPHSYIYMDQDMYDTD